MSDEIILADRAVETSTTQGTIAYLLGGAVAPDVQTFLAAVGDGARTAYVAVQSPDWEIAIGRVHAGSPPSLERLQILKSTNSNAAVAWGAGTRTIFATTPAGLILLTGNALSEIALAGLQAAARTNIGAASDALVLKIANALSELAATASTARGNIGAAAESITGQTGGSDGNVVRFSGTAGTWVAASQGDTVEQLSVLFLRQGGKYYPPNRLVPGFTGLDPAKIYYLGTTSGAITGFTAGTAPTIDSTHARVFLGRAITATEFWFSPQPAVKGA